MDDLECMPALEAAMRLKHLLQHGRCLHAFPLGKFDLQFGKSLARTVRL